MTKLTLLCTCLLLMLHSVTLAREIQKEDALTIAQSFLEFRSQNSTIIFIEVFSHEGQQLAWIANLDPPGFILVSPIENIRPIFAYSFESPWLTGGREEHIFLNLMKADLQSKLNFHDQSDAYQQKCKTEWAMYRNATFSDNRFEQWPPEGTTPTGGWLFTNWTQSFPYNNMCPVDPQTSERSYSGCPATAMSQILNCGNTINNTRFDDSDDYWQNFGPGNQYWIDNDWEEHGFPNFSTLNEYLEVLEENYAGNKPPSEDEIAALTFACGTALKQVYSSQISGTWSIEQARDAYLRFGFDESRLVYSSDPALNDDLAQNIMDGNPAHLGVEDPQQTEGHNMVVDGYNTNGFFHFNFGWGGNSNGWYTMPPTSTPHNLTVIEGIVLDILGNNPHFSINEMSEVEKRIKIYYGQGDWLTVINNCQDAINPEINVYDELGRLLISTSIHLTGKGDKTQISLPSAYHGIFVARVSCDSKFSETFKFVKTN